MQQIIGTSNAQSRQLIEAGISVDTADLYYYYDFKNGKLNLFVKGSPNGIYTSDVPAWSWFKIMSLVGLKKAGEIIKSDDYIENKLQKLVDILCESLKEKDGI